MDKAFVYGMAVSGNNFTNREKETRRIIANFEGGINTILISPRRMGKTSIINKVCETLNNPSIKTIRMDIYDCRSEYDFYNKYAAEILKQTSGKLEQIMTDTKEFLGRITPKISISPDMASDYSISLGITPKTLSSEEVLILPEKIAEKKGFHIIVCIDEFQQIGEFPDSLQVQKRLRSIWQHFKNVSFCFYGSKRHMMQSIFQQKNMPFYQFGDTILLDKISRENWIKYIISRFNSGNKTITTELAGRVCDLVEGYSSYVQQLAWNLYIITEQEATPQLLDEAFNELLAQVSSLYMNQIKGLSTYQMNYIRALCNNVHNNFQSNEILTEYNLGTKSNITRIKESLIEKELIEDKNTGIYLSDPLFAKWFRKEFMNLNLY